MRSLAVAGLCLVAATVISVVGSFVDSARMTSVICTVGAGAAFAGAASSYRATATIQRRGLPAAGMALLGIATSLWTVEATLEIAGAADSDDRALTVLAVFAGGVGLALLAGAAWRAGQVPRPIGVFLATLASIGAVSADPGLLYLTGAAPLGIALICAAFIWAGTAVPTTQRERTP